MSGGASRRTASRGLAGAAQYWAKSDFSPRRIGCRRWCRAESVARCRDRRALQGRTYPPLELCTLAALRDGLRRWELYIHGGNRCRNPEDDLPSDFDTTREVHYAAIPPGGSVLVRIRDEYGHPCDRRYGEHGESETMLRHVRRHFITRDDLPPQSPSWLTQPLRPVARSAGTLALRRAGRDGLLARRAALDVHLQPV